MHPWEILNVDFKDPLPGKNKYGLFVVDEFSCFLFAFLCKYMSSTTVISYLSTSFNIFGLPLYVHSDSSSNFISREQKQYLNNRGVATTRSTPYHHTANAQWERVNQTVWRTVELMLRNLNLPKPSWETVLPQSLHAVRSLLCTTTNATPHDRFLNFYRRSVLGRSLPNWLLQPGPVVLRRFVQTNNQPLVDVVELIEANPNFAIVKFSDGRESTVSVTDLAPSPTREVEAN